MYNSSLSYCMKKKKNSIKFIFVICKNEKPQHIFQASNGESCKWRLCSFLNIPPPLFLRLLQDLLFLLKQFIFRKENNI